AAHASHSEGAQLLRAVAASPRALAGLAVLAALLMAASWPWHASAVPAPHAAIPGLSLGSHAARRAITLWIPGLSRTTILWLHLTILLVAFLPSPAVAPILAFPLAAALAWITTPIRRDDHPLPRGTNLTIRVERVGWWVLSLAPMYLWVMRYDLTLGRA